MSKFAPKCIQRNAPKRGQKIYTPATLPLLMAIQQEERELHGVFETKEDSTYATASSSGGPAYGGAAFRQKAALDNAFTEPFL